MDDSLFHLEMTRYRLQIESGTADSFNRADLIVEAEYDHYAVQPVVPTSEDSDDE